MSVNIVLETKTGVKIHYLSTQLVRIRNFTYSPRPSVHKCLSRLVSSKSTQRYVVAYPYNFMSPVAFLFFLFSASSVIQLLTNPFLSFQINSRYLWSCDVMCDLTAAHYLLQSCSSHISSGEVSRQATYLGQFWDTPVKYCSTRTSSAARHYTVSSWLRGTDLNFVSN